MLGDILGDYDDRLRSAAMSWLDDQSRSGRDLLRSDELAQFQFEDIRVPLLDPQRGIRKPARLDAALSIRTSYTRPGQTAPYQDAEGPDGLLRYKYRGADPQHHENVALRRAFADARPLIWFVAATPGNYVPIYPIWIVADEPQQLQFVIAFDVAQKLVAVSQSGSDVERAYVEHLTKQRLHQPVFRAQVLNAYQHRCAMCQLRYTSLLDAAHILPDGHPRGLPVVPNGLTLCKLHHAAYDEDLIGVRPDLVVEVRADVRRQADGPMLLHGIQELDGSHLIVPRGQATKPDPTRLEERYEQFRMAS